MNQVLADQKFVDALKQRKIGAFEKFYDQYSGALYGDIQRTLLRKETSEETLKVGFINIWNSIDEYDPSRERLFTWAIRKIRKESRRKKIDLVLREIFICQDAEYLTQVPRSI